MLKYKELALNAKSWPFLEAQKILKKINNQTPHKGYVLFETGYGPSGLPHLGTFGEVARTSVVRYAFQQISEIPTRLVAFSDDLDGLRKVPSNVPNQELLKQNLNKPLTSVPDPFAKYASFGEHNNEMLKQFLNQFGFEYEFYSATNIYKQGLLDKALLNVLKHYDEILAFMLKNVGEERQKSYSPFLPIDKETGNVLQTKIVSTNLSKGTIVYLNEQNKEVEIPVTGGNCKLQWKIDWASRWWAFDVDYEMCGKDLIDSVRVSSHICKIMGKEPPINLVYEHFLDKEGAKISKSKGNGLSIEEWLRYGNDDSLAYFMYQKPQTAKRLFFDIIPKNIDDWLQALFLYPSLTAEQKMDSPLFFIHKDNPPIFDSDVTFSLLINLVSVVKTNDKNILWDFVKKYHNNLSIDSEKIIDNLLDYAINYYNDFIKPTLKYTVLNNNQKELFKKLLKELENMPENTLAKEIQTTVYAIGKNSGMDLKDWFGLLYSSLLGQDQGPRMGTFFAIFGLKNSINLINLSINRE
jgi:lysyl-tRNA synthetase class 1